MQLKLRRLENGEYLIRLKISAEADTELTVTANHRRFLLRGLPLKKGECLRRSFAAAIKDADFLKKPSYRDSEIVLNISGSVTAEADIEKTELPVVYCLGDSTVCDQTAFAGDEMSRCCGWGQTLGLYLTDKYAVSNHAEQGTHTADCLACHIKPVLAQLKAGDTVLVQFGHNDQKHPHLTANGGYRENLIRIANEITSRGGRCVLCTPINRLIYENGRLNEYLKPYALTVKAASDELGLMCIDLHGFTSKTYEMLGAEAKSLFYHSSGGLDRTHPNDIGGALFGKYAAECLLAMDKGNAAI